MCYGMGETCFCIWFLYVSCVFVNIQISHNFLTLCEVVGIDVSPYFGLLRV